MIKIKRNQRITIKTIKHIEIVISTLPDIHTLSLKSATDIRDALVNHYNLVKISTVNRIEDLEKLVIDSPDLVIIGMKRLPINNQKYINIPSYLENRGITISGSDSVAIELERNKTNAKDTIKAAGLSTSDYVRSNMIDAQKNSISVLSFPMFIKPTNRGAGVGIDENSVVRNAAEFSTTIKSLSDNLFTEVMVENYLSGREFSVSILKISDTEGYNIMPLEIIAPMNINGDRILGSEIKIEDSEKSIIVPDGAIKDELIAFSRSAFRALGARDYGRIDLRYNSDGNLQFIEANLLPSLSNTPGNYFPKACLLNEGLNYENVILRIVSLALNRKSGLSLIPAKKLNLIVA